MTEVTYTTDTGDLIFGEVTAKGIALLYASDGLPVNRLETSSPIYDVNSRLGLAYDHPNGIVIELDDARRLGITDENSELI